MPAEADCPACRRALTLAGRVGVRLRLGPPDAAGRAAVWADPPLVPPRGWDALPPGPGADLALALADLGHQGCLARTVQAAGPAAGASAGTAGAPAEAPPPARPDADAAAGAVPEAVEAVAQPRTGPAAQGGWRQPRLFADPRQAAAEHLWAAADERAASLAAAPWKVVDTETTALTPWAQPVAASAAAAAARELGVDPGDPAPRLRIVTARWPAPDGTVRQAAWDLDRLAPADRRAVARAALAGTVVGHNLGFDLLWLRWAAGSGAPWPAEAVDTLLLARIADPDAPLRLLTEASADPDRDRAADPERVAAARRLAQGLIEQGKGGWSLEALAWLRLAGRGMDKRYQMPAYWTLPAPLLEPLYAYATGDVEVAEALWAGLAGAPPDGDPLAAWAAWKAGHPVWEATAQAGQVRDVVAIREAGLPFAADAARAFAADREAEYGEAVAALLTEAPELAPWGEALRAGRGTPDDLRRALAAALEARGATLGGTATGKRALGRKALQLAAAEAPAAEALRQAWDRLGAIRKRRDMALDYLAHAAPDGRLHPLLGHGPISGRLSSQEPNIQNLPHDAAFRALVAAPPGWRLAAADYGAQEMRVAAALALRAQAEIRAAMEAGGGDRLGTWLRRVWDGAAPDWGQIAEREAAARAARDARRWADADRAEREALGLELAFRLRQVLDQGRGAWPWSALRDLFAAGLDVHLATALRLLGEPLPATAAEAAAAKAQRAAERQQAKAANFGLLYGMGADGFRVYARTTYGLDLSPAAAADLRLRWFAAFPELRLWQLWTLLRPAERGRWLLERPHPGGEPRRRPQAVWRVSTLLGRPFTVWRATQALNLQDQGSGADMTMLAIRRLWEQAPAAAARVVGQVHDEILLCAPDREAGAAAAALQQAMAAAGVDVLAPWGIPVGAIEVVRDPDGGLPRVWRKG